MSPTEPEIGGELNGQNKPAQTHGDIQTCLDILSDILRGQF